MNDKLKTTNSRPRHKIVRTIGAFILAIMIWTAGASTANAAYNGMQVIGLSKVPGQEIDQLAKVYTRVGGDLYISFLPYEFNPDNPFGISDPDHPSLGIDRFVKHTLPNLDGRLRINTYLYFHDYVVTCTDATPFDWGSFSNSSDFASRYMQRVADMNAWIKSIWAWATAKGYQHKLSFSLCPFLEDDARNVDFPQYQTLIDAINYRQVTIDRVPVGISEFRNPDGRWNNSRVGSLRMELHGRFVDVKSRLTTDGDWYSNDGYTYSNDADFIRDQRSALSLKINVAYWNSAFNGDRSKTPCTRTLSISSILPRIESILKAR